MEDTKLSQKISNRDAKSGLGSARSQGADPLDQRQYCFMHWDQYQPLLVGNCVSQTHSTSHSLHCIHQQRSSYEARAQSYIVDSQTSGGHGVWEIQIFNALAHQFLTTKPHDADSYTLNIQLLWPVTGIPCPLLQVQNQTMTRLLVFSVNPRTWRSSDWHVALSFISLNGAT